MDEARLRAIEDRVALLELEGRCARTFDSRDGDDALGRVHLEFRGTFRTADASGGNPTVSMSAYCDVGYRRVDGVWPIAHRITMTLRKDDDIP